MYFDATVKVIEIKKEQERPNFIDKYYLVRFSGSIPFWKKDKRSKEIRKMTIKLKKDMR